MTALPGSLGGAVKQKPLKLADFRGFLMPFLDYLELCFLILTYRFCCEKVEGVYEVMISVYVATFMGEWEKAEA